MSFDRVELDAALGKHGRVVRVVIAAINGSSPREVGAAMLVFPNGQSGTIGGGALEFEMAARARTATRTCLSHHALGPELGQCCGGRVTLLTEVFTAAPDLPDDVYARGEGEMPLTVARILADARAQGRMPVPQLVNDWMIEPISNPQRNLWIWGAGHVGRAIVNTLAPLPDFSITWIDTHIHRYPEKIPQIVHPFAASKPEQAVKHAPKNAEHLILTYSHELDFALCHELLNHGFDFAGLIGSKTKWARFKNRLTKLGHAPDNIARITCPIGDPSLGKHPQAIALGVGAALMTPKRLQFSGERRA